MKNGTKNPLSRLRKRAEFLAVAKEGRKWVAAGLILQMASAQSREMPPPVRYGLTASGKIGNAVTRNRARRRLRALVSEILPERAVAGDYVLIARAATVKRSFADLRQDLTAALKKLGAWRDR